MACAQAIRATTMKPAPGLTKRVTGGIFVKRRARFRPPMS
jgi:hypothetical protein